MGEEALTVVGLTVVAALGAAMEKAAEHAQNERDTRFPSVYLTVHLLWTLTVCGIVWGFLWTYLPPEDARGLSWIPILALGLLPALFGLWLQSPARPYAYPRSEPSPERTREACIRWVALPLAVLLIHVFLLAEATHRSPTAVGLVHLLVCSRVVPLTTPFRWGVACVIALAMSACIPTIMT